MLPSFRIRATSGISFGERERMDVATIPMMQTADAANARMAVASAPMTPAQIARCVQRLTAIGPPSQTVPPKAWCQTANCSIVSMTKSTAIWKANVTGSSRAVPQESASSDTCSSDRPARPRSSDAYARNATMNAATSKPSTSAGKISAVLPSV